MIVSVSRRTDIPAFYTPWFWRRLDEGFALVQNPMNPKMIRRVSLAPKDVDCLVFWTKNPRPLMRDLDRLDRYGYYFLFTITPYGPEMERELPPKEEIMDTFIELSERIGKERVIWRYDPILLTDEITLAFHRTHFRNMAYRLRSHTERCIVSFLDMYQKCERNLKGFRIKTLAPDDMVRFIRILHEISAEFGMEMVTCGEDTDFSSMGVFPGKCIDDRLIERIGGSPLTVRKDTNQRKACHCVESVDIGAYHSCGHGCRYCYANADDAGVRKNMARHDPASPLLLGQIPEGNPVKVISR
ncbi:MAG: DUF1848 domain-containing protein [Candidatus Omnitrophota bacterium]